MRLSLKYVSIVSSIEAGAKKLVSGSWLGKVIPDAALPAIENKKEENMDDGFSGHF